MEKNRENRDNVGYTEGFYEGHFVTFYCTEFLCSDPPVKKEATMR